MNSISFFAGLLLLLLNPLSASAYPEQPALENGPSPALQLARRVASIENDKDLPSRAVWLGKKVALNTRVACASKPARKPKKKQTN